MRRSYFTLLATISLAALLGVPNLAAAAPKNFGTIQPQDAWRVGTVDGQGTDAGTPYCAMVDRYEGDIFLAFARDAKGYGSLALDFAEDLFKQELEYEVSMKPAEGSAGTFSGRATTPRSLVVQVGKNDGFYNALKADGTLNVSLPVLQIVFGMKGFGASYKDLVECAASLGAPPMQVAEAGLDREVKNADSGLKVAAAEKSETPANTLDAAEEQIDKEESAAPAAPAVPERKLLASTKMMTAPAGEEVLSLPPSGVSAQDLEKHQLAAVKERPVSVPPSKIAPEPVSSNKSATASAPILIGQQPIDKQIAQVAVNTPRAVAAEQKLQEKQKEISAMQEKLAEAEKARQAAEAERLRAAEAAEKIRLAEEKRREDAVAEKAFEEGMKLDEQKRLAEAEKARLAAEEEARLANEKARMEAELAAAEKKRLEAEKLAKVEKERLALAASKPAAPAVVAEAPAAPQSAAAPPQGNRAAAFLDKIMGYHRKGGAPAPKAAAPVPAPVMAVAPPAAPAPVIAPPQEEKSFLDVLSAEAVKPIVAPEAPKPAVEVAKVETPPVAVPVVPEKIEEVKPVMPVAAMPEKKAPEPVAVSLPPPIDREAKPITLSEAAKTPSVPVISSPLPETVQEKHDAAIPPQDLIAPPAFDPSSMPMPEKTAALLTPEKIAAVEKVTERRVPLEPTPDLSVVSVPKPAVISEPVPVMAAPPVSTPPAAPVQISAPVADTPKPLMAKKPEEAKPVPAPVAAPVASGPLTLEKLLDNAGVRNAKFASVDSAPGEAVRQWSAGALNGMYEKTSEGGGNFDAETQGYLDRYREDCPGHLDVTIGERRTGMAGNFAPAVVSCTLPSNSYTTSFVFVQTPDSFGAIAHSGRPGDIASVKSVGDNVVKALMASNKFVAPEALVKKPAPAAEKPVASAEKVAPAPAVQEPVPIVQLKPLQPEMPPKKQLRFNIPEAKKSAGRSEFPTVVIE